VLSKRTLQRMNHQTTLSAAIVSKRTLLYCIQGSASLREKAESRLFTSLPLLR
jgi:hypothetical protein